MELLKRTPAVVVALLLSVLLAAVDHAAAPVLTLSVAGRSSGNVSLASDGPFVIATWSASTPAGATDIYAAMSTDDGRTFPAPTRVNSGAGEARVNGEQPPRAALIARPGSTPAVTIVWTAKGPAGTRLLTAESRDGARTFEREVLVPGTDTGGNRGWEAIASDAHGAVHIAWLDHRLLAKNDSAMAASHHDHSSAASSTMKDGVAMAQMSQLYVATLNGAPPRGVTGGVCYCCKTALAAGPGGALYAAWRHVYPGNLRDIAFTASRDDGRTFDAPTRVSEDKWQLEGCPDDGPAMAVDGQGGIHLVWPTLVTEGREATIGLFYAVSADGRRFSLRQQIPTLGLPHHPQNVVGRSGRVLLAWDELKNGIRTVALGRLADGSSPTIVREAVAGSESGIYPAIVRTTRGALVAWTANREATQSIRAVEVAF
jgi:hypothetical protein